MASSQRFSSPVRFSDDGVQQPGNGHGEHVSPGNHIAVARGADLVIIQVVGMGDMLTAPALSDFVDEQRKAGFSRIVFDMERCRGLDSTFMGVMVGIYTSIKADAEARQVAQAENGQPQRQPARSHEQSLASVNHAMETGQASEVDSPELLESAISAVNVSPQLRKLLGTLGVDRFVRVRGAYALGNLETTILPGRITTPEERRRLILRAHQNLISIDARNLEQFGPFLQKVAAELYS